MIIAQPARPRHDRVHDRICATLEPTEIALTCPRPAAATANEFLNRVAGELRHRYEIGHTTVQIEPSDGTACNLRPAHVRA